MDTVIDRAIRLSAGGLGGVLTWSGLSTPDSLEVVVGLVILPVLLV
jgi:hypothetical protein